MKQSKTFRSTTRRTALKALIAAPAALAAVSAWRPFSAGAQEAADPASLGTLNFIVGGIDFRSYDEPENSDVLMIARVDLINSTVGAGGIPPDLWVRIPNFGEDKLPRPYDYGSKA